MNRFLVSTVLVAAGGLAFAKLPPPDDATKAKAAETSAKAAWQTKVDSYKLCKVQDQVAAQYMKTAGKTAAKETKPAPAAAAPVAAGAGTPVAAAQLPPCTDPGPFAYNPPSAEMAPAKK